MNVLYQDRFKRSLKTVKDLYVEQRNWGYGKFNNANNIPEFMSLEYNCEHSILYPPEY